MIACAECPKVLGLSLADLSSLATVLGVIVAVWAVRMVRTQIRISNSIRTAELIAKIYDAFAAGDLRDFYARIRKKEQIDWEHYAKEGERLDRSLTLFDEVDFLRTQRLLRRTAIEWLLRRKAKAWEYVASEVQYFALNDSVWCYMEKRLQEGRNDGLRDDIIPYTGFPALFQNIPHGYRITRHREISERHKDFFAPSRWAKIRAWLKRILTGRAKLSHKGQKR